MKVYGVVTMDIVNSRNISNRNVFQEKLNECIEIVNKKYQSILPVPISFTLGDEWQLITSSPEECYNIIHDFQQLFWFNGISFYAGIGIGALDTNIYGNTRMMDGRCFISAREAIDIAKGKNRQRGKHVHSRHNRVFFRSELCKKSGKKENGDSIFSENYMNLMEEVALSAYDGCNDYILDFDRIINALIENTEILKGKMTSKQKETYINYFNYKSYRKMLKEGPKIQAESISSISQKLNTANYFTIQNNHALIKNLIYNAITT